MKCFNRECPFPSLEHSLLCRWHDQWSGAAGSHVVFQGHASLPSRNDAPDYSGISIRVKQDKAKREMKRLLAR